MYRFLTLIALFLISIPVGLSVAGCGSYNVTNYCQNLGYGLHTTDVYSIDLEPKLTGISLSYGQTSQGASATAYNCNHQQLTVSKFTYASSNRAIADLSPAGAICAGTWNKDSGGGIADYTICNAPATSGTAYLTAEGGGATSNTVTVFVHPPVTSATLDNAGGSCMSQFSTVQLDATAYVNGSKTPFCSSYGNAANNFNSCANNPANGVPDCICNLGHLNYNTTNGGVVTIDPQTGVATSRGPGTTLVTTSISSVSLDSGYLTSCPPAKIELSVPPSDVGANGVVNVIGTAPVPITATVTDINGNPITGLPVDFTTTNPLQIAVGATGSVSTTFPGIAQISALCEPPLCNPSPIDKIGQFEGTGQPASSNTLTFQSPGISSTLLWVASSQAPYFTQFDLSIGTASAPVKMPYTPNSMVIDDTATTLYFGSYRELMVYAAAGDALSKEDPSVPGVVLAVSPLGNSIVISDQIRQVIYLYSPSAGLLSSTGGVATHASYSTDGNTLYVTGPNALYVHSSVTGWSTYALPTNEIAPANCPLDNTGLNPYCSPDVATTNPGVGAFISGTTTTARSYCFNNTGTLAYYPPTTDADPATDHLTTTADGKHVIGASASPAKLTDITTALPTGLCPSDLTASLQFSTGNTQLALPVTPGAIDQVVSSYDSSLAFITYSGAGAPGAVLPAYQIPATQGTTGTLIGVPLTGGATAPLAGVFSPNNLQFFVGTSGDNLVHVIDTKTFKDIQTINPALKDTSGKPVPVEFLAVKPRTTT